MSNENRDKKMIKEPKLPHRLERGDRTAAKVGEAECLTGIGAAGYTGLKDVVMAEVHESVADEAGARGMPEDLTGTGSGDVFMEKPRAGAYYKYMNIKNIVHEES